MYSGKCFLENTRMAGKWQLPGAGLREGRRGEGFASFHLKFAEWLGFSCVHASP